MHQVSLKSITGQKKNVAGSYMGICSSPNLLRNCTVIREEFVLGMCDSLTRRVVNIFGKNVPSLWKLLVVKKEEKGEYGKRTIRLRVKVGDSVTISKEVEAILAIAI